MKKFNLKDVYTTINKTIEKEVYFKSIDLENNKIKHIIIGDRKINQPKKSSSMTNKQFQEYVIQFIQEQKEFNKMILQEIKEIKVRLDHIESCPTIQKEIL